MASYLLQWKAIGEGKKRGCEVFDFLGIAHPDDLKSPLIGVTDFKLKLTDETKEWPKAQILVTRKFVYAILGVRKAVKRWKNRFVG
jgi:lipid II:glycine glycyltransferase (peptidoglycan interpeptide bridge formation enzyme)